MSVTFLTNRASIAVIVWWYWYHTTVTNVNTLAQRAFPSTSTNMTTTSPSIAHIFRGNFVFCTRNPFFTPTEQEEVVEEESPHVQWLGPGLKLLLDHVMTVDTDGRIVQILTAADFDETSPKNWKDLPVTTLPSHSFLVPGLIDTHIHAPQFAYTGTATDRPLMGPDGWLETYTFPAEARLADDAQACRAVYKGVVDTTLVRVRSTDMNMHVCTCACRIDSGLTIACYRSHYSPWAPRQPFTLLHFMSNHVKHWWTLSRTRGNELSLAKCAWIGIRRQTILNPRPRICDKPKMSFNTFTKPWVNAHDGANDRPTTCHHHHHQHHPPPSCPSFCLSSHPVSFQRAAQPS